MGWLQILNLILPLIMKFLELFQNVKPDTLNARQVKKLGQFKTACLQLDQLTTTKGLKAKALPASASLLDD